MSADTSSAKTSKEFNIAAALVDTKPEEAAYKLTLLLDDDPANPNILLTRAQCWLKLNLRTFALRDLQDAHELFNDEEAKEKCRTLSEAIQPSQVTKHNEENQVAPVLDAPPKGFTPPLDLVTIFHAWFNHTKLDPKKVRSDAHLADLSRANIRLYCTKRRFNSPPIANLDELKILGRYLGSISVLVDFKRDSTHFQKACDKYNAINGERAAEDLIEMLQKGITPPTRTAMQKTLINQFARENK